MRLRYPRVIKAIVTALLANGCICERNSAVPMVGDVGMDVSTKYRYRIACVYKGETSEALWFSNASVARYYPRVFSADGLLIELRIRFKTVATPITWARLLSVCSMGVIPVIDQRDLTFDCSIELADAADCNALFDLASRFEHAYSLGLPTAFLLYNDEPSGAGHRVFFKTERSIWHGEMRRMPSVDSGELLEGDLQFQQALAYAVAVKLKELEDSGKIDAMLNKKAKRRPTTIPHNVVRLDRDSSGGYLFAIDVMQDSKGASSSVSNVLDEFSKSVKEEYLDTFPNVDSASLSVAFPKVKVDGMRISGHAVVLTIKPIALAYDANARRGKLSVRFNAGQVDVARAWIQKNIEVLARDKNIALVTGEIPPKATFYVLDESVKDGNVLEVGFKTE